MPPAVDEHPDLTPGEHDTLVGDMTFGDLVNHTQSRNGKKVVSDRHDVISGSRGL